MYKRFPEVKIIGAHIASDKSRVDFEWSENISGLLPELQAEIQTVIDSGKPITKGFSDEAAEQRFWEVEGFARVPCGGTHLNTTDEVGDIRLRRKTLVKGRKG